MDKRNVLVAMSGGVDSSVAALLLLEQGHKVAGATYRLWEPEEGESAAVRDARRVCGELGIPHHILDFRELFRRQVLDSFAAAYLRGRTPNPCVTCNRTIKFGAYLDAAKELGFDTVATGHYARVERDAASGVYRLLQGVQPKKDQSYFLCRLTQKELPHVLFPLGGLEKPRVRELAEERGLSVSRKADSQDICFIPGGDYGAFLDRFLERPAPMGQFVRADGTPLGPHKGITHYTIGQRKGLGLALGEPAYVTAIDPVSGAVTLGRNEDLLSRTLVGGDLSFVEPGGLDAPLRCEVKIRSAALPAPAVAYPLDGGRVRVEFDAPQRAITPGQAAVLYRDGRVIGGATILAKGDVAP